MKKSFLILGIVIFFLNLEGSILEWQVKKSDEFEVFYHKDYNRQAAESLYYMEKYNEKITELTGNKDDFKTRLVLQDPGIVSNGYANIMNKKISLYNNVPDPSSELAGDNWYKLVGVHEMIHINQMSINSEMPGIFVKLFGYIYSPNIHLPLWVHEGITVYGESQIDRYNGRLNTGYYNALINSKAKVKDIPSLTGVSYTHDHFPMNYKYIYGGGFTRYLANKYGEDSLGEFYNDFGGNSDFILGRFFPYFGMDKSAKNIWGKSFYELFEDWKKEEYSRNINWKIRGNKITDEFYDIRNLIKNDKNLYYVQDKKIKNSPYDYKKETKLIRYNTKTGISKELFRISNLNGRVKIYNNKIYYIELDLKRGFANVDQNGYGYTGILYSYNLDTGKKEKILKDNIRSFLVRDKEIIYSVDSKKGFGSVLWKYEDKSKTKVGEVSQIIGEMTSSNKKIIVVSKLQYKPWNINKLNFDSLSFESITNTSRIESRIKTDDNFLYYTGNYNGKISNFRYNFKNKKNEKIDSGVFGKDGIKIDEDFYFVGLSSNGKNMYKNKFQSAEFVSEEKRLKDDLPNIKSNEGKIALKDNFKYIFKPNTRFNPFLIQGQDGIGFNNYMIIPDYMYSENDGWDVNFNLSWETKILKPIGISVDTDFEDVDLSINLPIYRSLRYGFNNFSLSIGTDLDTYYTGINLGVKVPRNRTYTYTELRGDGYIHKGTNEYLLDKGSLILKGDFYNNQKRDLYIRGLKNQSFSFKNSSKISFDIKHALFSINKGFWNPNIFLGDVYGTVFSEYIMAKNYDNIGYGIELDMEFGIGFINLIPKVGYSYADKEGNKYIEINFSN